MTVGREPPMLNPIEAIFYILGMVKLDPPRTGQHDRHAAAASKPGRLKLAPAGHRKLAAGRRSPS